MPGMSANHKFPQKRHNFAKIMKMLTLLSTAVCASCKCLRGKYTNNSFP